MTEFAAGWYPDPSGGPGQRWWDGMQWTNSIYPAANPAIPQVQQGQYGQQTYLQAPTIQQPTLQHSPTSTVIGRNRYTAMTVGVAIGYLALAVWAHIAILGIVPILMSVRAFKARERLAPLSAVAAGIAVIVGIALLAR